MTRDPHGYGINVGDRVRVLVGECEGDIGRVVVRRYTEAFGRVGVTFEIDFEFGPHGRGYSTQYQPQHLERIQS